MPGKSGAHPPGDGRRGAGTVRAVRLLLVVNATASSVTARTRMVITKALAADHELVVADTSQRGHATRLAGDAADRGVDAVVVLGGDGTLNEAANGLAGSSTALAALPGGSTNVFARTLGYANDPVEATGQLLAALESGTRERVGLGSVNGRYFLFHLGVGFDAAVVERVERRSRLKRQFGHGWFAWNALAAWFGVEDRRRARFAVRLPGDRSIDDAHLALFLNSDPYTWFGPRPLSVAPGTTAAEPLSVVVLRSLRFGPTFGMLGRALVGGGSVARSRWTVVERGEERASVEGYGPVPHQVDGEYLGVATALEVRHHPGVLDLIVPPPLAVG